jgi:hypothetical protein
MAFYDPQPSSLLVNRTAGVLAAAHSNERTFYHEIIKSQTTLTSHICKVALRRLGQSTQVDLATVAREFIRRAD